MERKSNAELNVSTRQNNDLPRAATKLERKLIEEIPTLFARLVFVSAERPGLRTSADLLAQLHRKLFNEWLCLRLKDQRRDILSYCDDIQCDIRDLTMRRLVMEACEELIPRNVP